MIIGINGKVSSGKDTVGKIVQYLIEYQNAGYLTIQNFLECYDGNNINNEANWKIKKFAAKLKQICSLLTGIPVEDFEKIEVKNTIMPDQWQIYEIFLDDELIATRTDIFKAQDFCAEPGFTYKKTERTYRWLLINVGTEAMREIIHPNIWCSSLFSEYDEEQWKPVIGYEDSYAISSYGNVKSFDRTVTYGENIGDYHTKKSQAIKSQLSSGYKMVTLKGKTFTVHKLVALHFLPKPENENFVINHIDFNKTNNYWKNLEWISQAENIIHNHKYGKAAIGEQQKDAKLDNSRVFEIKKLLAEGVTQRIIAKAFDVSPTTITDIKKGRKWKHVGKELLVQKPIIPPNWVITDLRFKNELVAIKNHDGITIRITRPGTDVGSTHSSEIDLDNAEFDFEIKNEGTIEELIKKVHEILLITKII